MKLFLLALLLVSFSAFAQFGDKIGNGGGLWACMVNGKMEKSQLVDLFEAEKEFLLKIIPAKGSDPMAVYKARKAWIAKNIPSLYADLESSFSYVEKNIKVVRANLTPIDDHGLFRSKPQQTDCSAGEWVYTQFANSNDQEEVLIQSDLWNSGAVPSLDKAALLVHEAVYRWLRISRLESDSLHTRKITGLLFSDLGAAEMHSKIKNVLGESRGPGVPGQVIDADGFYVKAINQYSDSALHIADGRYGKDIGTKNFSAPCRVPLGVSGKAADLFCVLELEELDLYFNTISLQIHVPTTACSYLRFKSYDFLSESAGKGPETVVTEILADGSIRDVENSLNGRSVCPHDHTATGGSNCCTGTYDHKVIAYASDGSYRQITSAQNWGGKISSCISGPGNTYDRRKDNDGFQIPELWKTAGFGINTTYNIGPIQQGGGHGRLLSNLFAANFYNPSDHGGKPLALRKAGNYQPQDTYQWDCLDGAGSIKARIRLMIRDWNSNSIQEDGNPDETGQDGDFPGADVNDHEDWKDIGNTFPGPRL